MLSGESNYIVKWSCDQNLVILIFLWEKLSEPKFFKYLTRKSSFFEECFLFKFNYLALALVMALKLYTSVAKGLQLKFRNFWELILTFVEVTVYKLAEGTFLNPE